MLDGLLAQLLTAKWTTAARDRFRLWLGQFLLFMLLAMLAYCSRFKRRRRDAEPADRRAPGSPHWLLHARQLATDLWLDWGQCSEIALVAFVLYYVWLITSRIVPRWRSSSSIINSISQAPEIALFSATCLLVLVCVPLRLLGLEEAEDVIASLVMFNLPLKFLFFCRASKSVGPFVVVIYKIVANDVLCFIVLLVIFVGGFSQCE